MGARGESRYGRRLAAVLMTVAAGTAACARYDWTVALPEAEVSRLGPVRLVGTDALSAALSSLPAEGDVTPRERRWLAGLTVYLAAIAQPPTDRPIPDPGPSLVAVVNAHLAWSLAIASLPELSGLPLAEVERVRVPVGGRLTTLAELADAARRLAPGEPRVGLFLNPGRRGWPPYPPAALDPASISLQLADHAERCGRTGDIWALDAATGELRVPAASAALPGLPAAATARARRLLDLVPPPAPRRAAILARCGDELARCRVVVAAATGERWRLEFDTRPVSVAASVRPVVRRGPRAPAWFRAVGDR